MRYDEGVNSRAVGLKENSLLLGLRDIMVCESMNARCQCVESEIKTVVYFVWGAHVRSHQAPRN